jgi:hypothetical protein
MKEKLQTRIKKLQEAIDEWLSPDNTDLKKAIDKTVDEGLFSFEDIKYQIRTLKKTLKKSEFEVWAQLADLDNKIDNQSKQVLCLHAGNLPLVGIQDILAVVLSGNQYVGKLSRKDPYLPVTLLEKLRKDDLLDGVWSVNLDEIADQTKHADKLMFSGSTDSVQPVIERLETLGLAKETTTRLMRTAHYSIAFIEDDDPETFHQLAEAVLRYGGSGCRSVAMVIAPFELNSKKCEFTDYVESFWLKNPQHKKPEPSLYHRFAYNKAVGIEQSWLDDFLIEQTDLEPVEPFILHWIKGDVETLKDLARKHRDGLQTVYVTNPDQELPGDLPKPEMLSDAQRPPIWWRPDGVDPLKWLTAR